ncbi:unnamed protein product [Diatraea saccharalis]|uniref:ubiquitinyl hydrolase 1 n=1 Tax=Diatraea saccharalis TaxID=40085 RepID=A0A9N9WI18_9NEOP|nr:unnamed protein product [Diatraea saccharalis]
MCVEHSSVAECGATAAAVDLASCLRAFTSDERLEAAYHCAHCRSMQPATKKMQLWRAPPILVHYTTLHYTTLHCAHCRSMQPATKKMQLWRAPPILVHYTTLHYTTLRALPLHAARHQEDAAVARAAHTGTLHYTVPIDISSDSSFYITNINCFSNFIRVWVYTYPSDPYVKIPFQVIHLKRFQYVNNKWTKSQKVVNFPFEDFDPTEFLAAVPQETILRHRELARPRPRTPISEAAAADDAEHVLHTKHDDRTHHKVGATRVLTIAAFSV